MKVVPDSYIERNDMADEPGPPDPEDLCMVCNKLECECPPEDLGAETPPAIDPTHNETDHKGGDATCRVLNAEAQSGMTENANNARTENSIKASPLTPTSKADPTFEPEDRPVSEDNHDSTDSRQPKEELGASDEHVKRMITFGEMWHRKKLTPKELADAIIKAKQDHPEDFPS